jgi:microcystin degradation protein MlrC
MRKRVLVGCFALEANCFARGETTLEDFAAATFAVGRDIHPGILGDSSELAGAGRVLEAAGIEIVPSVVAWVGPRPPVAEAALDEIERLALAACDDSLDGIYFMFHGSAVARTEDDPEGRILAGLRDRLGPGKPITISLDHHAHLTRRMVDAVDGIAAYRTCPHVDAHRTGTQAGRLLVDALEGHTSPVVAMAERPMITPPELHDSSRDPFRRLMGLCDDAERDGALAAALLPVTPWLDVPAYGWKAAVTTDGDRSAAAKAAEALMDECWRERFALLPPPRPGVDDALEIALAGPPPFVFADAGDATNGGSTGDSTELLRAALRCRTTARIVLSVRDATAAETAYSAGEGANVKVTLGGGPPGEFNESITVSASVERTFDGEYRHTHPVNDGYRAETGKAALLKVGTIQIVVHSRIALLIDAALYEALGIDPTQADVIQAKSHISYKAGFDPITTRSVVADTAGPSSANLAKLPYRRRPIPLFPLEPIELPARDGNSRASQPRRSKGAP